MKKMAPIVLVLWILSGCAKADTALERGMTLRSKVLQGTACSFDAVITADYGEKLYTYETSCQGDDQGNLSFTVTAPETISGITGTVTDAAGKLTFDDVALQFDKMADDQVTPVSAPWIFLKTLRSGCLTSAGMDGSGIRLSIDDSYEDDALHLDIWLDDQDLPKRAEILYDGCRILSLDIKNFQIL